MAISAFLGFWTGESAVLVLPLLLLAISVPWDNRLSFHKSVRHCYPSQHCPGILKSLSRRVIVHSYYALLRVWLSGSVLESWVWHNTRIECPPFGSADILWWHLHPTNWCCLNALGGQWSMEIPLSFGETWTLIGVPTAAMISSSLKWLFAVCAAVMDLLRWIVLCLHGSLGPGGVIEPIHKNERRRLQDLTMQSVFPVTCTPGSCWRRIL